MYIKACSFEALIARKVSKDRENVFRNLESVKHFTTLPQSTQTCQFLFPSFTCSFSGRFFAFIFRAPKCHRLGECNGPTRMIARPDEAEIFCAAAASNARNKSDFPRCTTPNRKESRPLDASRHRARGINRN